MTCHLRRKIPRIFLGHTSFNFRYSRATASTQPPPRFSTYALLPLRRRIRQRVRDAVTLTARTTRTVPGTGRRDARGPTEVIYARKIYRSWSRYRAYSTIEKNFRACTLGNARWNSTKEENPASGPATTFYCARARTSHRGCTRATLPLSIRLHRTAEWRLDERLLLPAVLRGSSTSLYKRVVAFDRLMYVYVRAYYRYIITVNHLVV